MPPPSLFIAILLLLLLLLLLAPSSAATHDIATRACTAAARSSPNVHYPFCVAVLRSHRHGRPLPRSLPGLTLLTLYAARGNATRTARHIEGILKEESVADTYVRAALGDCLELYGDAAGSLKAAARAVRKGRLPDANALASTAVDAPGTCDDGFEEVGVGANPVAAEGKDLFQLAVIALAFLNMI